MVCYLASCNCREIICSIVSLEESGTDQSVVNSAGFVYYAIALLCKTQSLFINPSYNFFI